MKDKLPSGPSDLNHPKIRSLSMSVAQEMGLDRAFIEFLFAKERPRNFKYWCEDTESGWTCYLPKEVEVAYPLWSTNADQTLLIITNKGISYAKGWHDNNEIEPISNTSQGLLARLINEISESEATIVELKEASQFCGFRFLEEYLAFIESDDADDENWESAWSSFVAMIDESECNSEKGN